MRQRDLDLHDRARTRLLESSDVQRRMAEECVDAILASAGAITDAFRSGGKVLLCGNGGSAADCQHMATEFVGQLTKGLARPGLPAIALTTDSSFLTAYANDTGFEGVFERQVQALGKSGDVLIGITTSGNSLNVVRAVKIAKSLSMKTIALTGYGGKISDVADIVISVPSDNTQYIQEAHSSVEHLICELVEAELTGDRTRRKAGQARS